MILLFILLIILLFTRHYFVNFNLKNLKVRAIHLGIIEENKKKQTKWMASHHPNLTRANPNYTAIQHSNALQSRLAGSGVEN